MREKNRKRERENSSFLKLKIENNKSCREKKTKKRKNQKNVRHFFLPFTPVTITITTTTTTTFQFSSPFPLSKFFLFQVRHNRIEIVETSKVITNVISSAGVTMGGREGYRKNKRKCIEKSKRGGG